MLTESIIVIVFFVVVLGCVMFVHRLYGEKIVASRRARERAWTDAMAACPRGGGGAGSVTSPVRPDAERLFSTGARRATGLELLASPVSFVRQESETRVTPSPSLGIMAADVKSTSVVTCNERVVDLDPHVAAEIAWHGLTGW